MVFEPPTDCCDVRKATYQEYVATTDYNVARIPQTAGVKEGAALGVACVAAAVSPGVSFGVDFSSCDGSRGPETLIIVRGIDH